MTPRALMTEYLTAARRGDWDTAFGFFADDLEVRIPGRGPFAGRHRGKAAAVDYISTVRERFAGRIELELIDMLASDDRVVLVVRERFLTDGDPIEIHRANAYRVRDGRIVGIAIFEGDQYVVDERLH
ncbi:MAG: nuclear transport factor 2 family protein [Solirubrobacterales bacterium]|nr:nuclear transport factor 2 family protein [Solirubrobacterales bacterium]